MAQVNPFIKKCIIAILLLVAIFSVLIFFGIKEKNNQPRKENNIYATKQIECKKLENNIKQDIEKYNSNQKEFLDDSSYPKDPENPIIRLYLNKDEFKEVFYSPKTATCLYEKVHRILITDPKLNPDERDWGTSYEYYELVRIPTNILIEVVMTINRSEIFDEMYSDINKIIATYK